jgi:hypothetical protein
MRMLLEAVSNHFTPSDKCLLAAHLRSASTPPVKVTPDKPPNLHARAKEKATADARRKAASGAATATGGEGSTPSTTDTPKALMKKLRCDPSLRFLLPNFQVHTTSYAATMARVGIHCSQRSIRRLDPARRPHQVETRVGIATFITSTDNSVVVS